MATEEGRGTSRIGPQPATSEAVHSDERVQLLVRQLAEAEIALASLADEVDGVADQATLTPVLLQKAQVSLADLEERYDRLVARMPAIVFEMTVDGAIVFINESVSRILGYAPQELTGPEWWNRLVPRELRDRLDDLLRRVRHGDVTGYELPVRASGGARVTLSVNSANRYGLDGRLQRVVVIATDITAHKQAELQRAAAYEALATSREQLQALSRRLVQALEDERRVIARELHDESGQALTALSLKLGTLTHRPECPPSFEPPLQEALNMISEVQEGLHRLAMNLRPASLDRLGLVPALRQYAEDYQRQTGIDANVAAIGTEDRRFPSDVETVIYRVVQEALTNVARHAKAAHVCVIVQRHDRRAVAIVEDDGTGFDVEEAMRRRRLGLVGMRERVEMLGGTLTIESEPGSGTTIFAEIPCDS